MLTGVFSYLVFFACIVLSQPLYVTCSMLLEVMP